MDAKLTAIHDPNAARKEWGAFDRVLPETHWFEVYRIDQGTYAIYEPGHFEEVISFLIIGTDKALLFDTGLGLAPIKPVVDRLTNKTLIVLNSHSHYDHVGGNHEFDFIIGLDNPYCEETTQGLPNHKVVEYVKKEWLPAPPYPDFDATSYKIRPWELSAYVTGGYLLNLGGRTLEIIETPGEAPDGICLLDEENRTLFTGDTFYLGPLYAHLPESNFSEYVKSVDKLAALEPKIEVLMTSHNVPVVDACYLAKLKKAFQAVSEGNASSIQNDECLEYKFGRFSIVVADRSVHCSR